MKEETAAKKTNPRESFVRKRGNALKQETQNELERFRDYLREQEKSSHTIEKYCRDVRKFLMFVGEELLHQHLLPHGILLLCADANISDFHKTTAF